MLFYIILILLLLLFIPLPLKFSIFISKEEYFFKFYNLNLFSKDDGLIKKILNKMKNSKIKEDKHVDDEINKANKNSNKKEKKNFNIKFDKHLIKNIYKTIKKNKFKPSIKYNGNIKYSLSDSSNTAIFYGLLSNINPFLYYLFNIVFKVKKFKNKFNPIFKDEIIYELSISCIITFNLAQIIYIALLILKCLLKNKEVNPV